MDWSRYPSKEAQLAFLTKYLEVYNHNLALKKVMKAGTCYVWRVWPYTGRAFTRKPVGVSNFCIANSKVLKNSRSDETFTCAGAGQAGAIRSSA